MDKLKKSLQMIMSVGNWLVDWLIEHLAGIIAFLVMAALIVSLIAAMVIYNQELHRFKADCSQFGGDPIGLGDKKDFVCLRDGLSYSPVQVREELDADD